MLLCIVCIKLQVVFLLFKQKTAYDVRISDWSSDVCSSDLGQRQFRRRTPPVSVQRRGRRRSGAGPHAARASRRGRISAARPYRRRRRGRTRGAGRIANRNIDGGRLTHGVAVEALERRQRRFEREVRSEEHTSELQSLMRISYAVF